MEWLCTIVEVYYRDYYTYWSAPTSIGRANAIFRPMWIIPIAAMLSADAVVRSLTKIGTVYLKYTFIFLDAIASPSS